MEEICREEILQRAQHVFDAMKNRASETDMNRVKDAFAMASEAHSQQTRKSGEPYIVHPIAVARIAAEELELDANTVIAAFLHDVVEDTPYTVEDIQERFGEDVAFLVNVVTKRKKEKYAHTKQVDNYKQILASVNYDVRALLVKLSDRLHNMRTLDSMLPEKQMKIAGETDFFYAPLAGRLGLYHVKSELENLSFRFRCPREYKIIEQELEDDKLRTADTLKLFIERINELVRKKGITARTQIRYRMPYSVWRDMKNEACDFMHVDFKHYVRVIYTPKEGVNEKDTSLQIYSILSSEFRERPGSVINFIDNPKDNGYQSFHVKFLNQAGAWEELHIASERMHLNSKLGCVVERGESWLERFRNVLRDIAEGNDGYFMEGVSSSLYNEDIIAFTPKGRGVILPKGATALDFAFEVHTTIGEHAQYARINGKLCPIKTELHRGDCVEIGTNSELTPQPEWLEFANTYKAKRRLHELLKHRPRLEYQRCEICQPLPGDEVIGFKDAHDIITLHSRHCPEAIHWASENGDSIVKVDFEGNESITYPIHLKIVAVDRYHLLRDIIDCFVEKSHLSMNSLKIVNEDQIVTCLIDFSIHSIQEVETIQRNIALIDGVDEVQRQL